MHRFCISMLVIHIFAFRVHVSIRCCFTFPFTYTYSYAANPDNSNSMMTFLKQMNLFSKISSLFSKLCFVLHLYQTIIRHTYCHILYVISPVNTHKATKYVFVAVFLGCTRTGRVGLCFCGSMSRNSRRLNRQWF